MIPTPRTPRTTTTAMTMRMILSALDFCGGGTEYAAEGCAYAGGGGVDCMGGAAATSGGGGAAAVPIGAPQLVQNPASEAREAPHFVQNVAMDGSLDSSRPLLSRARKAAWRREPEA